MRVIYLILKITFLCLVSDFKNSFTVSVAISAALLFILNYKKECYISNATLCRTTPSPFIFYMFSINCLMLVKQLVFISLITVSFLLSYQFFYKRLIILYAGTFRCIVNQQLSGILCLLCLNAFTNCCCKHFRSQFLSLLL